NILAVRTVETSHVPAETLPLAIGIDPSPVWMGENRLIVELQTVITDHRHAQLPSDLHLIAKEVPLQVGMPHGHIALIKGIPPVVLGIKHHAFGAGIASRTKGCFQ